MSTAIDFTCIMCKQVHPDDEDCATASESALNDLLYGGEYNFKNQPERLKYIGKKGYWHQFEIIGKQGVWCELLDTNLYMIEETKAI